MRGLPIVFADRILPRGCGEIAANRARLVGPHMSDLSEAEAVIASGATWDGEMFDKGPNLKVVSRSGIGFDAVDLEAATARGIVVCNAPESPTISTAEHAIALLLHVSKSLTANQRRLRAHIGDYYVDNEGIELCGRTLGLVGFGAIAKRVAKVAQALEMVVIAHDPYLPEPPTEPVELVSFPTLLRESHIISIHCPLTDQTKSLFNAQALAQMRPGAMLINTARGGIVDQEALVAALESGQLSAAGLDVTVPEPLPMGHPLQDRDNVIVTPHIASATDRGRLRMFESALENALEVLAGNRSRHCVNPDVYLLATATNRSTSP